MAEFTGRIDLGYRNTDVHNTTGFEILGMVPPKYYNTYVVTICFMEGDADGSQYEEVQFTDEAKLKDFVDFCFRCAIRYPNGKGGHSHYKDVEGYARFVGDFEEEDWDEDEPWPGDADICLDGWPMQDYEWYTSFDWFKVEYYGTTGQACTVKVTTEVTC